MKLALLGDIHGNALALQAVACGRICMRGGKIAYYGGFGRLLFRAIDSSGDVAIMG